MKIIIFLVLFFVSTRAKRQNTRHIILHEKSDGSESNSTSNNFSESKDHLEFVYQRSIAITFYNKTVQTLIKFDYLRSISAYFIGETGEAFILNFNESPTVYIPPNVTNQTWTAKTQSFENYTKAQVSLLELYNIGLKSGIQVNSVTIPEELTKKLAYVIASQTFNYTARHKCGTFGFALAINRLIKIHRIIHFEDVMVDDTQCQLRGDVRWYFGIISGINKFFGPLDGFNIIRERNIIYKMDKILDGKKTGFGVLFYFLEKLSSQNDLIQRLKQPLNNVSWFFEVVALLSGEIYFRFDGFLQVISKIVKYASKEISQQDLHLALTEYFLNIRAVKVELRSVWLDSIKKTKNKLQELKLNETFKSLVSVLEDIQNNKWKVGEVNLSDVVDVVIKAEFKEESIEKVLDAIKKPQ